MSSGIRVWARFTAKSKNGNELKVKIQDAPKDRLDDVAHLFAHYYATEENFFKISGIPKNEEAVEECKKLFRKQAEIYNVAICCADDDNDPNFVGEIMAASLLLLRHKGDPEEDYNVIVKTKEMNRFLTEILPEFQMYDVMNEMNLDIFYDDRGLVVHPNYRGFGLAQNMLNVRRMICKAEGVPITGAWMTAFGTQKAAERDGWESVFEITYEEFGKLLGVEFIGTPRVCTYMVAKI